MRITTLLAAACAALSVGASKQDSVSGIKVPRQAALQDIVTWDQYSLKINGKRIQLFSGEIHPYRIPVASNFLDIFQKIKSMGFNGVSFYVFWGIHEPKRGEISFEGFRDLQPLFDAAMKTGIYLIARPGPYINAETTGGGFPGWGTYTPGLWRTMNATYVDAYRGYIKEVGAIIAKNEITSGGSVILAQVENEYSGFEAPYTEDFEYESTLMQDFRDAGIKTPLITNDAWPGGHYTMVDIYGHDAYPNGFDCANPTVWKSDAVPEWFWGGHMDFNSEDPYAVYEFQGGGFDGWGGSGYEKCSQLTGAAFERVFYKNQFAMSNTIFNIYMIYGGTNWGGIAYPNVYTSYDYGSAITESRTLREKYYELKLQAAFRAASPAWLTTRPQNIFASQGAFTGNDALKTTLTFDVVGNATGFYVVRQTDASSDASQSYKLTVPTSIGTLTVPLLGGTLSLNGKDSKIHVVDYTAGSTHIVYSTGEIMTWATIDGRDVIIIYGGSGELHETAFKLPAGVSESAATAKIVSGSGEIKTERAAAGTLVVQYRTTGQTVVEFGNTLLYIVDRENAYQFWVLYLPSSGPYASFNTENPVIVKGGYLLRTASSKAGTLEIQGDLDATTSFEVIAPKALSRAVTFNGAPLRVSTTSYGTLTASRSVSLPAIRLPSLQAASWKSADSLPEIQPGYSDAKWTVANHNTTVNPRKITTPVVLYSGDYGYHTGNMLWRGHFTSTGSETAIVLDVWGGTAFAYSVWLNDVFIGSWEGDALRADYNGTFTFPTALKAGGKHVVTVLQDHMGYEGDWWAASDLFKRPRGIINYSFVGGTGTQVSEWKLTGNLGGESYVDRTRGPFNEGGLYAERQGWHLPGFNDNSWANKKPTDGISKAGVGFFRTSFNLDIPSGVDYPLALVVSNTTTSSHFRAQFYVNGYQFGKYVNHIGPQTVFPVPQGVLNYKGANSLGVSIWAADASGAKLNSFSIASVAKVETSLKPVVNLPATGWTRRPSAY